MFSFFPSVCPSVCGGLNKLLTKGPSPFDLRERGREREIKIEIEREREREEERKM